MRFLVLALALGLVATVIGCRLKNLLPAHAVLKAAARGAFEDPQPSAVPYSGPARAGHPILPFQAFGVQYAVDIVLVTQHPAWDMHEYARLDLPEGSVWIAKDSDHTGVQTITSDLADLEAWLPEIPVRRVSAPLMVEDRSEGRNIDIALQYTNPAGDPVEVRARGTLPKAPPSKRNGNTMGHSRDIVAAVLDLERFGPKLRAEVRIGGKPVGFRRIMGLVPFKFLLRQSQGGFAIANYRLNPIDDGWSMDLPGPGAPDWPTRARGIWLVDGDSLLHDNGVCRFIYRFEEGGLATVRVRQAGMTADVFKLWIQPAMPDLRRPFEGTATSRFRMDVGGQAGHGTGEIRAQWTDEHTVTVDIVPTQPHWLADRPMRSTIRWAPTGEVDVRTERVDGGG